MTTTTTSQRRLVRSSDNRMLGGVCAGVADYLGVDVTIVRLLTVVGTVLGFGSLIVAYVVAWLLMPEA
jgi:phage shock protein PspC (stress-responsive transcriptional regulator)